MEVDIDLRFLSDGDQLKDIYRPGNGATFSAACDTVSIHPDLGIVEMPVYVLSVNPDHPMLKGTKYNALSFILKFTGEVYVDCTGIANWKRSLRVQGEKNSPRIEATLTALGTVFRVTCTKCSVVDLKPAFVEVDYFNQKEHYESIK